MLNITQLLHFSIDMLFSITWRFALLGKSENWRCFHKIKRHPSNFINFLKSRNEKTLRNKTLYISFYSHGAQMLFYIGPSNYYLHLDVKVTNFFLMLLGHSRLSLGCFSLTSFPKGGKWSFLAWHIEHGHHNSTANQIKDWAIYIWNLSLPPNCISQVIMWQP